MLESSCGLAVRCTSTFVPRSRVCMYMSLSEWSLGKGLLKNYTIRRDCTVDYWYFPRIFRISGHLDSKLTKKNSNFKQLILAQIPFQVSFLFDWQSFFIGSINQYVVSVPAFRLSRFFTQWSLLVGGFHPYRSPCQLPSFCWSYSGLWCKLAYITWESYILGCPRRLVNG